MSTTDTISVTYTGTHAAVYVPGIADPAQRGTPIDVPRELGEKLIAQGWDGPAGQTATETADAPPTGETPTDAPTETAEAPATGETADDPSPVPPSRRLR
jgi:hypothetical protein